MAETIRGLTVEIAADASSFNKQMSALRRETASSQKELDALQKGLALDCDPTRLARAQEVAQRAIDETAERAELLSRRLSFLEEAGNADTSHYRKIQAELAQTETRAEQLRATLERLDRLRLETLGRSIKEVGEGITDVGEKLTTVSLAAGAAITALGALGAKSIAAADEIATLATQYELSTDALQRFNYIALQTDTDSETLYKSFVKMRAALAELATGATSQASAALSALGVSFDGLSGNEEQFLAILSALADMEDRTRMVALANDLFGERLADKLLPMLYAGSEAIQAYAAEYETLGALSGETVEALAAFDNLLNTLKTQFSNVALSVGASLLPVMERLAAFVADTVVPRMQELAEWMGTLNADQQSMALAALALTAALGPVTIGVGKLVTAVGDMVALLPTLHGGLEKLGNNKVVIIVALVAAALLLLFATSEQFRASVTALAGTLANALAPVLSLLTGLFEGIFASLTPLLTVLGGSVAEILNALLGALAPIIEMLASLLGTLLPTLLTPVLTLLTSLLGVLDPVLAVVSTLLSVVTGVLSGVLTPLVGVVAVLLELLAPILQALLLPLTVYLNLLQIPLQLLCALLGVLASGVERLGDALGDLIGWLFSALNDLLGFAEGVVNTVIDLINELIGTVNQALSAVGLAELETVGHVRLTTDADPFALPLYTAQTSPSVTDSWAGGTVYDSLLGTDATLLAGGNDYSTHTSTQNVTVVVENYAERVDVDDLVRQINRKLAEAM